MNNRIKHLSKTISPTAFKAVGRYGRGWSCGPPTRAPDYPACELVH
ncbi:MAG: hypothetical protein Q8N05_16785 [Bacteroidota bacterium]|nr:hypothetical protein [Bacteroidota bacterium]